MRVLLIGLLLASGAAIAPAADDLAAKPALQPGSFQTLEQEYDAKYKAYQATIRKEIDAAKKAGKPPVSRLSLSSPSPVYSARFLAYAQQFPDSPDAPDALVMALSTSFGPRGKLLETRVPVLKILRDRYITKPEIRKFISTLVMLEDPDADAIVREVIAKNPDREIQLKACRAMIGSRESMKRSIEVWKGDEKRVKAMEKRLGKEGVAEMLAAAERYEKEITALKTTLRENYADLIPEIAIGTPAPEVVSQDLDGKTVRLSDYRGKVVVIDVWTTWCGPCKAMIPHEREMVERLKNKPFQLVSISADEKKETLKQFLATEKMPWTHWWVGRDSKFDDEWDIRYFPTIYVIDAKGVIRHKDLRGPELEKAVDALLTEIEPKKTAAN